MLPATMPDTRYAPQLLCAAYLICSAKNWWCEQGVMPGMTRAKAVQVLAWCRISRQESSFLENFYTLESRFSWAKAGL
jgi:hypothetical protein